MNPIIYGIFPELERFEVVSFGTQLLNSAAIVPGFVRAGVSVGQNATIRTPPIAPTNDVWWHFRANFPDAGTADENDVVEFRDSVTDQTFARINADNGTYFLETSTNGSSFTRLAGASFGGLASSDINAGVTNEFDIHVVINPGGTSTIEMFINQNPATFSFSGDLGPVTVCDQLQLTSAQPFISSGTVEYFELLASDSPTFGTRIASNPIEATLLPNDFSGLVSDIASISADNTAFMSGGVGDEQAFRIGDLSAMAGTLNPVAVFVQATAQGDGVVGSLDVGVRIGGTFVPQNNVLGFAFQPVEAVYDFNNPVTGMPWTITDIDNMEAFFRAVAS